MDIHNAHSVLVPLVSLVPLPMKKILYRYYLCFLMVLLPLKFCTVMGSSEQPNFPMDIWQWLLFTCIPNYFLIALCGLALIWGSLLYRLPRRWLPVLPWLLILLAGLLSLANTTELEYAQNWLEHFSGACVLCAAVWIGLNNDDKLAPAMANVIGVMGLICAVHGWYQHFIGLEENRRATLELAEQGLMKVSGTMAAKLEQTRIYGTFADPNVYAANLLFCLPFSLLFCNKLGRRFEKPLVGVICSIAIAVALFLGALYWSGSRGGAVGAAACIGIALCCIPRIRNSRLRLPMPLGALALAVLLVLAASMSKKRDMATASMRIHYYKTALKIFAMKPIAGAGIGEYFTWYMRLKPSDTEITREPHNLPLALLSQCGIPGGLAALAFYILPWLLVFVRRGRYSAQGPISLAAAIGCAAWSMHSLFQFNELIPGTAYLVAAGYAIMPPAALPQDEKASFFASRKINWALAIVGMLALLPLMHARSGYFL